MNTGQPNAAKRDTNCMKKHEFLTTDGHGWTRISEALGRMQKKICEAWENSRAHSNTDSKVEKLGIELVVAR
jgi:hypothetical protein